MGGGSGGQDKPRRFLVAALQFCHFVRLTHCQKAGLGGCLNILLLPTSRESSTASSWRAIRFFSGDEYISHLSSIVVALLNSSVKVRSGPPEKLLQAMRAKAERRGKSGGRIQTILHSARGSTTGTYGQGFQISKVMTVYRVVFFNWSALKMTKCQTLRKF